MSPRLLPRFRFRAIRPCAALLACAALACHEGTAPPVRVHEHRLLIPGSEEAAGVVVNLDLGTIEQRLGPGKFVEQGPSVLTRDGAQLITIGRLPNDEWILVGIQVATGRELWHQTIALGNQPSPVDGVRLGTTAMVLHPQRTEVLIWRSVRNSLPGVAVFDYRARRVTGFIAAGTDRVRSLAAVPANAAHPAACAVMAADSGGGLATRAFLLFACGNDYTERDTVAIAFPTQTVGQMQAVNGGRTLVLATNAEMLTVDAESRLVQRRAARPLPSPFVASETDGRLFIPDGGSSTVSSSGIIYVLDPGLELAGIFDLRTLPRADRPLGVHGGAVSHDGRWLYLVGGVGRAGAGYGPEETRIFIIELATGAMEQVIGLGIYGGAPPFLVR